MTKEELRALRLKYGLTQRGMGEMLGYATHYILKLENGHAKITQRFEKLVRSMFRDKKERKSPHTP
jgi:transcriptional regulator with XRE-family HTH domain